MEQNQKIADSVALKMSSREFWLLIGPGIVMWAYTVFATPRRDWIAGVIGALIVVYGTAAALAGIEWAFRRRNDLLIRSITVASWVMAALILFGRLAEVAPTKAESAQVVAPSFTYEDAIAPIEGSRQDHERPSNSKPWEEYQNQPPEPEPFDNPSPDRAPPRLEQSLQ